MVLKHIKSAFIATLSVLALSACAEEPQDPMRVGTNVWPGYEPAYLARDLGHYTDAQVRLSQFQSSTETIRAFRNGAIDVVALTLDEALLLIQDGLDVKIFLVADISDGGDVIMAKPHIKTAADLKGLKVGVESSALGAYVLARALEINNVAFSDVELVHMTVDESEQAYLTGAVDAVVTFEPYRSRLMRSGAVEVFTSRQMPNEIVDVLVVRTAYAEQNANLMRVFSKGWFSAVNYIQTEPNGAAQLIGKRLGLTPAEALASFQGLILPNADMNIELLGKGTPISLNDSARKLEDILVQHGLLNTHVSLKGVFSDAYAR